MRYATRRREFIAVLVVLMLSAVAIGLDELRLAYYLSLEMHSILVYFVFFLNAAIGLWTPHRIPRATYLMASAACLILFGGSTPISGLCKGAVSSFLTLRT
jgi:hypothetical protein